MNGRLCATRAEATGTPYLLLVTYKLVLQDRGSPAGPPCAVCCQASELTQRKRKLRDFRFPREENLPDQLQLRVPPFGLAGIVEARGLDQVGNGLGAVVVLCRPDGESSVAIESYFSSREVTGQPIEQGNHVVLGEERQKTICDNHGWPIGGHFIQPIRVGQVHTDTVRLRSLWDQQLPSGDNIRKVEVIPINGRGRSHADHPAVQPDPQIQDDCVRVAFGEPLDHLVQLLRPVRNVDDQARAETELLTVVVDLPNDLVRRRVVKYGVWRAAVERPAAQRQKHTVLHRRECRKRDSHDVLLSRAAPPGNPLLQLRIVLAWRVLEVAENSLRSAPTMAPAWH